MPLSIPPRYEESLDDLIAMPHDERQRLRELISTGPPVLDRDKLAADIASTTELAKADAAAIVSMLASLYRYRAIEDIPVDEFAEDVCDAVRASEKMKTKEVNWDVFKQDLIVLLSGSGPLEVTAKVSDLQKQHPRVYCRARILTDIRPVFKQDAEAGPVAAFVIHALRISSHDEGDFSGVKDFFVSLDADDLRELRGVIDRALVKEASLKSLIQTSDMHYVELEEH